MRAALLSLLLMGTVSTALAVPVPPPGFSTDTAAELFTPTTTSIAVELFDLGDLGPPPGGLEFGFYYASDPGTLITIFDVLDAAPPPQSASIDFVSGIVLDLDSGVAQSVFTPKAGSIGFYLSTPFALLFTESSRSPGGGDFAFDFISLADPSSHIIGFDDPAGTTLAMEFIGGLSSAAVPEPGTVLLIGAGLLLGGLRLQRRR